MDQNNQTEFQADVNPPEEPQAEQEAEKPDSASEPQPDGQAEASEGSQNQEDRDTAENQEDAEQETVQQGLEVEFNNETHVLSREDAAAYAQIGMKIRESGIDPDTVNPMIAKLDYIAAQRGKSIDELVDGLLAEDENAHRRELAEKLGEDNGVIDDLMKVYRDGQKERYAKIVSDRKEAAARAETERKESLEARLAKEFTELREEFPEITEFSMLPKEVKADAAGGKDLTAAYLRYLRREEKRVRAAERSEEAAAKASTGSASSEENTADADVAAFLSGVYGK